MIETFGGAPPGALVVHMHTYRLVVSFWNSEATSMGAQYTYERARVREGGPGLRELGNSKREELAQVCTDTNTLDCD